MSEIDFVITWVDGNDPKWQEERRKYEDSSTFFDNEEVRYRDWGLLKYWFRCVEKNAPWVRKIHFVTWGHVPKWLDTDNPKLNIVKHTDFIPSKYLPTFNSHTIELNLHRIKGLSEKFVYFNDDMFITDLVSEEFFFKYNLPCDSFLLNGIYFKKDSIGWINGSNIAVINDNFSKKNVIKKNMIKFLNYRYGLKRNIKNIMLALLIEWFPGIDYWHVTSNYLKSTFYEVWEKEYKILDETCLNKFRGKTNVNQFLIKNWQLVEGKFQPASFKTGHCFHMNNSLVNVVSDSIIKKKYKVICINDTNRMTNWEIVRNKIKETFEICYSDKSQFEK